MKRKLTGDSWDANLEGGGFLLLSFDGGLDLQ